jgi:hypothetical protein
MNWNVLIVEVVAIYIGTHDGGQGFKVFTQNFISY